MLLCIAIGSFVVIADDVNRLNILWQTLIITAMSGISTSLFVATWILCVRKGAYVMAAVFFAEKITKKCVAGMIVTFISMIVMNL